MSDGKKNKEEEKDENKKGSNSSSNINNDNSSNNSNSRKFSSNSTTPLKKRETVGSRKFTSPKLRKTYISPKLLQKRKGSLDQLEEEQPGLPSPGSYLLGTKADNDNIFQRGKKNNDKVKDSQT